MAPLRSLSRDHSAEPGGFQCATVQSSLADSGMLPASTAGARSNYRRPRRAWTASSTRRFTS